jgi:hypothetical protein
MVKETTYRTRKIDNEKVVASLDYQPKRRFKALCSKKKIDKAHNTYSPSRARSRASSSSNHLRNWSLA